MKKLFVIILAVAVVGFFSSNIFAVQINEVEANAPVIKGQYTGTSALGSGVYGYASNAATSNATVGVAGLSASSKGIGVLGWGGVEGYGVYAICAGSDGYAIMSVGNARINGNLEVTGAIPEYTNLASSATVTSSSEYNASYADDNVIDGLVNRWNQGEWATAGEKSGAWLDGIGAWVQLDWVAAQDINEIKIYDRPNRFDQVLDAWIQILHDDSSVSEIHLGMFPYGCASKEIALTLAEGSDVVAIKVVITDAAGTTLNVGLSEIECYYNPNLW